MSFHARAVLGAMVLFACSSPEAPGKTPYAAAKLPALAGAPTTLDRTLVPTHAVSSPAETRSPSDPELRAALLAEGFGDFTVGPGEPTVLRAPPAMTAPAQGANPKLLVRFAHMPDLQLADDESPSRLAAFDTPGATNAAFRPQDVDQCRVLNAAVRTLNALQTKLPMSFLLLGGDNSDDAQEDELGWVLDLLGGSSRVECDSGADDDPTPGPGNDGKDPFVAEGLKIPFYWVTGNHDVLVQGNFAVDDFRINTALGDTAIGGTRDWSLPGGPVGKGPFPTDAKRKPLHRAEVMARVAAHGDGHGVGPAQVASGKANYTFDVPSTPLRFVILDTAAETGASDGVIRRGDVDTFVKPTLDKAQADGKYVVLASHHAVASLSDGTGLGGTKQADALTQDEWKTLVGGYPNVLFSIVGHSHQHRVTYQEPTAGHGWWEVMTSALADFPHQLRVLELWDDDNGWIRLRGVLADYATDDDPVAAEGRKLGILDYTSGWCPSGVGIAGDRNVELVIPKP
ncbi:MAG TPA: hypothetical protein VF316_02915 [Polyangiaceae bacterium]